MSSTIETGHAKNVANFEDLISFCQGYGSLYNPVNTNIAVTALQAKQTAALAALQNTKAAKTAFDNATNNREIAFLNLKKLATRIVNALEATSASKQTVDDAKTVNRKIQGKRADNKFVPVSAPAETSPSPSEGVGVRSISVSQQSFDSLIDNFAKLIQVVSTTSAYAPNETELKVATLNTLLTNLRSSNTGVISATTAYSNSRIARNSTLYAPVNGLVGIAFEVKKYVKSLFGATSPQYGQVSGLSFRAFNK